MQMEKSASNVRQLAATTAEIAAHAQKHAEATAKYIERVQELTEQMSSQFPGEYQNSEIAAIIEQTWIEAEQAGASAADAARTAAHEADRAKTYAEKFPVEFSESEPATSNQELQTDFSYGDQLAQESDKDVVPMSISKLPAMATIRSIPRGALQLMGRSASRTKKAALKFHQIDDNHDADFLPGGYVDCTLHLYDDMLEVRRAFGRGQAVSITWRMKYQWNDDHTGLLIGTDAKKRPPPAALAGFTLTDIGVTVSPAKDSFPLELPYEELSRGRVRIGRKLYRRDTSKL